MKYDYLIYLFLAFSISKVHSSYFDYIYPYSEPSFSNYGSLGLIQNPNARFLSEGFTALSWSHNEPYLRGSIIAYPFNWMEASFQYTDLNNALYSPYPDFSGSQSLKDKSFDVKFRVIKESNLMPSVAVGLRDIGGTGLFASEYIVFSKYIYENIDATIGIGWGNLNGGESIGNPLKHFGQRFENRDPDFGLGGKLSTDSFFAGDAGIFAGLEIFIPRLKGVRVKLEFDGTNYDTEGVEPLAQNSRTNIGLLFPISDYFNLKLSSTRGNTINFGFSYKVNLSKNNVLNQRKEKRNNIKDSSIIKKVANQNNENLYKASIKYLSEEGFYLQKAELEDDSYRLEYAQKKFRNPVIASGRVTAILDEIIPDKVTDFEISLVNGGIGVNKVRVARDEYQRVRDAYADPDLLSYSIEVEPYNPNNEKYDFSPEIEYPRFFSSLSPDLRTQIGGPDGFFFGDLKITSSSELLLNRNLSLITVASYGIYNNLDELKLPSDSILPHVRTEIVNYLKESRRFSIRRMQLNKFGQYGNSLYYKFSAGILESMFGGVGFEGLFKPFNKD